jgi:hypothetical protein
LVFFRGKFLLELLLIEGFLHVRSGVGLIVVLSGKMSVNESRGISVKGMFNQKSIVLQTLISMFVVLSLTLSSL